eukprot:8247-Heterococcus_DN1.PRE.2
MSTEPADSSTSEKRQKVDNSPLLQRAAHNVQRLKLELILQDGVICTAPCETDAKLQKTWAIVQGRRRFTRPICATFTNLSNALASPSRLVWAWSLGLSLAHKDVSMRAGICACRATIQAGEARGLQLNQAICEGAASAGRLP